MSSQSKPNCNLPSNLNSRFASKFWDGLRQRKLLTTKCPRDNLILFPPRIICPKCLSEHMEWVELSGRAKLRSWTLVHFAGKHFETPYILGFLELQEGGILISRIEADPAELKPGLELMVDFLDVQDGFTMYLFKPAR